MASATSLFSDRYETIDCIYETDITRVELVRHLILGDLRIKKSIRRTSPDPQHDRYEAKLLCSLRHPGIPVLYDYGEDDESVCLIEEYIEGISLAEYMRKHGDIPIEQAARLITEICEILDHLHNRRPYPVLYRDLKPDHIILRDDHPVLIDYGIAVLMSDLTMTSMAGTRGRSAPEQFLGGRIDVRSDIYALGVLSAELFSHTDTVPPLAARRLIDAACAVDPKERPSSALEFKEGLQNSIHTVTPTHKKSFYNRIAVVGNDRGIGVTHIALALTAYLNRSHYLALYIEERATGVMKRISLSQKDCTVREGLIYHGSLIGAEDPLADKTTGKLPPSIRVCDCGMDTNRAIGADRILYVCSSRPWKEQRLDALIASDESCRLVINPQDHGFGEDLARRYDKRVYAFPSDKDPLMPTRAKNRLFAGLLR